MLKKLLIGFFILFLIAQAIQPPKNQGNNVNSAQDINTVVTVPENVLNILKKSCYDCHSNNTVYPWYDNITPVNWWVANHIKEGKLELNFNEFAGYSIKKQIKKFDEIAETVEEGQMPLSSYLITHGDAELDSSQKNLLVTWAKNMSANARQRR